MKIFILFSLLLSTSAHALQVSVDSIETDIFISGKFKISSSKAPEKGYAALDCQSFFQKMDFFNGDGQLVAENYITVQECTEIHKNITSCLKNNKIKCLDSDYIFESSCQCN